MIRSLAPAVLALVAFSGPALAETDGSGRTCGDRAAIMKLLTERYREVPSGSGVSETGDAAFEMFRSSTGSWTITMTTVNGLTCVMAAGRDWQDLDKVALLPRS